MQCSEVMWQIKKGQVTTTLHTVAWNTYIHLAHALFCFSSYTFYQHVIIEPVTPNSIMRSAGCFHQHHVTADCSVCRNTTWGVTIESDSATWEWSQGVKVCHLLDLCFVCVYIQILQLLWLDFNSSSLDISAVGSQRSRFGLDHTGISHLS